MNFCSPHKLVYVLGMPGSYVMGRLPNSGATQMTEVTEEISDFRREMPDGDATPLMFACFNGDVEQIKLLSNPETDSFINDDGHGVLSCLAHSPSRKDFIEILNILVAKGVDLDTQDNSNGYGFVHLMVLDDSKESFMALMIIAKSGANLQIKTSLGRTPLEIAISQGKNLKVELLNDHIKKGAGEH